MCLRVLAVVVVLLLVLGAFAAFVAFSVPVTQALYTLAVSLATNRPRLALLLLVLSAFAVVIAFGDSLVTLLLRKYAHGAVGDRIELHWSVRQGVLEFKHVVIPKRVLPALEPIVGFPVGFESVELQRFAIELPLIDRFVYRNKLKHPRVHLTGLQINATLFASKRYDWDRSENAARLQQSIQAAAKARLARIDAWTAMIVQKLAALAPPASALRTSTSPTLWDELVSRTIDSLAVDLHDFRLSVRDESKALSSVNATLETLTVGRSYHRDSVRSQRTVELIRFEVLLHPGERILLKVRSMAIDARVNSKALRTLKLAVSFPGSRVFPFRMHPRHLVFTRESVLRSLHHYGAWHKYAVMQDQRTCVTLTPVEAREYVRLFHEQWTLDATAGFATRVFTSAKRRREIATRRACITELETKAHAVHILELRAKALGWILPRPDAATAMLNSARRGTDGNDTVLHRGNVTQFLQTLVATYARERQGRPDDAVRFHRVRVTVVVWSLPKRFDVTDQVHASPPASVADPFAVDEPFFSAVVAWALDKQASFGSLW